MAKKPPVSSTDLAAFTLEGALAGAKARVDSAEVAALLTEAEKARLIQSYADGIVIEDDETAEAVAVRMNEFHALAAAHEAKRKSSTRAVIDLKAEIDQMYNAIIVPYEMAKKSCSLALGAYKERVDASHRALTAASSDTTLSPDTRRELILSGSAEAPRFAGTKDLVTYEVTVDDIDKVPPEYIVKSVDVALVKARAAAADVAGVAFSEPGLTVKRISRTTSTGRR